MSQEVRSFYIQVIKQFIEKLNKRYETRDGLDSNLIDGLHTKLREKMKQQHQLFKKLLNLKHQDAPVVTEVLDVDAQQKQIKSQNQNQSDNDSDFSDDFRKFEVKKQQNEEQEVAEKKQQPKKQQILADNEDSAEEHIKQQKMQKAQKGIALHIVGTYSTKLKKHIAKDQRTKFDLYNVFVKTMNANQFSQMVFQKLTCDFNKNEGDSIRLQ